MNETQTLERIKEVRGNPMVMAIAHNFAAAYISYVMGVTYRTTKKNYTDKCSDENLADIWVLLADTAVEAHKRL